MLISPHFTRNYAPASSSSFPFLSLRPPRLSLTADETFSFLISPRRFKRQPCRLDLALLFTKDYLIISILKRVLKQNTLLFCFFFCFFGTPLLGSELEQHVDAPGGGRLPESKCFGVTCVPFLLRARRFPSVSVARIYFISLMWVTPGVVVAIGEPQSNSRV